MKRYIETGWLDPRTGKSYITNFNRFESPFQIMFKLQRIDAYFRRRYINPYGAFILVVVYLINVLLS